ncbi:putative periplasmic beta-glucosidase precursor [Xylogone sp. PMI_703]|nr:putative periplasmic beta-glucosidase precursor [Xylogone sp. PMI_703]
MTLSTISMTPVEPVDSTDSSFTFQHALQAIKDGQSIRQVAQLLLSGLTKDERLSLLDGDIPFWEGMDSMFRDRYNRTPYIMGSVPRLGIPGVRFADGPRGVVLNESTAFPVSMARGATWDIELERRVGNAIGLEAKAQGANYFAGVCVNLPRHPAWGRAQETYSDDPLLLGEFGFALTQGVQKHIMACVKHYALNSMENARFRVDVEIDEDALQEVYLPHFRRIVQGGVTSVMPAYNSVNGEWAGQNNHLLNEILRDQWGFDGFVLSDFVFGMRDSVKSVKNGLDIEAPFSQQRNMHLKSALASGELEWSEINRSCLRILSKELEFGVKTEESQPDASVVFSKEHRALAREAAEKSMVLLKNEHVEGKPLLPLNSEKISKIAVVGRFANTPTTGDKGSSQVFPPHVVTAFKGLKAALPNAEVVLDDSDSLERVRQLASQVDAVVCIVGYNNKDEGEYLIDALEDNPALLKLFPPAIAAEEKETFALIRGDSTKDKGDESLEVGSGGDRKSLRLREEDMKLIEAVATQNPRTIVSIIAAGAVIMEEWKHKVPAILMSWYSGCEGGHALANVLFGQVDTSGRLPFSIPTDESHLPFFDRNATKIRYDRWHGQRLLDKLNVPAAFPLGFGLSYTTFTMAGLRIEQADINEEKEEMLVRFSVSNTGTRRGRHIAQVYGLPGLNDFPVRVLLGFTPVDLDAGESKNITVSVSLRPLQRWVNGVFRLPSKDVEIEVSSFSGDPRGLRTTCKI